MGDAVALSPVAPVKRRRGEGAGLRRVAEIVMVLAAAGEARGGREPTAAERALAAEARGRLAAAVSEGAVRPKDLFPGEAVRAVVEDLGLNRAKDPAAMGFRPPKASIADRLTLTKRKMEEVKESPVQPTITPSQITVSSGTAEFQGSHAPPMFALGTVRNPPAVAAMPTTAPVTSTSVVVSKPRGSSPVKPVNPSVVALSHTGQPQKSEKGVNGPSNLTRVTAGHLNKSFQDTSVRSNLTTVTSTNQVVRNPDTKVAAIQAVTGNPPMGHHATPGAQPVTTKPTLARHNEIAKNVQRFLRQPANNPSWTPPSTEYMHARLDCQICKVSIMDANSLLVCDACERGAHLKCLQHYGNKGVPIADWHCPTCVAQSKGKTLPPKYGKVTRTVVASQAGPPGGAAQLSVQGAAGNTSANENHQKVAANGNLMKANSMQAGSTVHNSTILALNAATRSESQSISVPRSLKGNVNNSETSSDEKEGNVQPFSTGQHNVKAPSEPQSSELTAGTSSGSHSGKSSNENVSSGLSLHSVDSGKDTMHDHQSAVTSGINCLDSSFAVAAGANIRSEALPSTDVDMVNSNGTLVDQISNIDTEEKIGTEATSDVATEEKVHAEAISDVATEEKVHAEAISEPQRIKDIEMTNSTGTPMCQSSNIAIEENHTTGTTLEPHTIEDMEMTVNTAKAMDETNNVSTEEARSVPASAVKDVEMATNVGTATYQTQLANESTENGGRESPSGATLVGKSDVNATPDHHSTHQVLPNGVLHITGEVLCSQEGEPVDCSAAPREETS